MPGPQRYDIFETKFHSLNEDMTGKKYKAIPHEKIVTGVIEPRFVQELSPETLGSIEARNSREAVEKFREERANHLY
jgi:hypothetical protein